MTWLAAAYWACIAAIIYHHAVYPVLLRWLARRRPLPATPCAARAAETPSIALIIPCHNEEAVIERKLRNVMELDYPADRLSVTVALDGCTDETSSRAAAALRAERGRRIRLTEYPRNIGKVAVLNDQIAAADSDVIALNDCSAVVPSDGLQKAATHFSDPQIGVVCSAYQLSSDADKGERAYWTYQRQIKAAEARAAGPMGAHGALYFFRRSLWEPLPEKTINDDFVMPMRIVLHGYKAVYDESIIATELEHTAPGQDFRRRMRIGAGNLQQLLLLFRLADPRRGRIAFVFLSGKALRAVMPFVLALAFMLCVTLAVTQGGLYIPLLFAKVVLILIACVGNASLRAAKLPLLGEVAYVAAGHVASGLGALLLLAGKHGQLWRFSRRAKHS